MILSSVASKNRQLSLQIICDRPVYDRPIGHLHEDSRGYCVSWLRETNQKALMFYAREKSRTLDFGENRLLS